MCAHRPRLVAVVFGGTGAIGTAVARLLLRNGYQVAVTSRCHDRVRTHVATTFNGGECGTNVIGLECCVTDEAHVDRCLRDVQHTWTTPSVVINAAGLNEDKLLIKMDVQSMKTLLETNLLGTLVTSKVAARFLLRRRHGCIINTGSVVGTCGNVGQAVYGASKAGLVGLTKSLAKELGPRNVRVNLVSPGFIETEMTRQVRLEDFSGRLPLGRFGRPQEVAEVVAFLASATYITGAVITVDGGLHLSY